MIRRMWFLTVNSDNRKLAAISLFVIPLATSDINWRCRHVKSLAGRRLESILPEYKKNLLERWSNKDVQSFGGQIASPCTIPFTAAIISADDASFRRYPQAPICTMATRAPIRIAGES